MRQRAMIAMGLINNPDVLIADEPTTALDVTVQAQILELIDRVKKEYDIGVILITHDLGVIAEVAQTVMVMYAGRSSRRSARTAEPSAATSPAPSTSSVPTASRCRPWPATRPRATPTR